MNSHNEKSEQNKNIISRIAKENESLINLIPQTSQLDVLKPKEYPFVGTSTQIVELNNQEDIILPKQGQISFKIEAFQGNFFPSLIKLESQSINVDQPINESSGDTLLHLASFYSLYNIIRVLIEKFNANINVQNKAGYTPLHYICANPIKDLVIFTYLLNNKNINIELEDQNGLTPVKYAVINNFNIAFMCLVERGTNLGHIDKFGNNIVYLALTNNNIFVINFLYNHCYELGISVNTSFYSNSVTLSDILITNKNIECCSHIIRNYTFDIEFNSLVHCCKFITDFPFYNRYNYEYLNTLLYYKASDFRGFFNSIYPIFCGFLRKSRRSLHLPYQVTEEISFRTQTNHNSKTFLSSPGHHDKIIPTNNNMVYYYKMDNLRLMLYFILSTHHKIFLFSIISYCLCLEVSFFLFYFFNKEVSISIWYLIYMGIDSILLVISFWRLIIQGKYKISLGNQKFSFNEKEVNIFNDIRKGLSSNDAYQIPFEKEICEICLSAKSLDTVHCYICNQCTNQYYFHSRIFNFCIHRKNIWKYILFLTTIMIIHCIYGIIIPFNVKLFTLVLYFYFVTIILIGKIISLIYCIGLNVGYHHIYNYHKENNFRNNFRERNNEYYAIPKTNITPLRKFINNLIYSE